mmetsp:Transcript_13645/g.22648  ORF Transcript_13645/g.22648 Transcript_13645/m.22648 type:complete len:215 (+) Transcript_13645:1135-1779(+)
MHRLTASCIASQMSLFTTSSPPDISTPATEGCTPTLKRNRSNVGALTKPNEMAPNPGSEICVGPSLRRSVSARCISSILANSSGSPSCSTLSSMSRLRSSASTLISRSTSTKHRPEYDGCTCTTATEMGRGPRSKSMLATLSTGLRRIAASLVFILSFTSHWNTSRNLRRIPGHVSSRTWLIRNLRSGDSYSRYITRRDDCNRMKTSARSTHPA